MPRRKKIKVIIDTNLFISYLIGKRLVGLKSWLVNMQIVLVFAEQNLTELELVSGRKKFRKYFNHDDVFELLKFIRLIGEIYEIDDVLEICRDPKDDFLLELAKVSKADFMITGDKDLLEIKKYHKTEIITIDYFENIFK